MGWDGNDRRGGSDIAIKLAMIIERLDNTIKALTIHQEVADKLDARVNMLERKEASLAGKIAGIGMAGMVVGFFISAGLKFWGK